MNDQGPRNIGLSSIIHYSFPVTAMISILHRITGALMVLLLPFLLWAFHASMCCPANFYATQNVLLHSPWSIVVWIFLSALSYHIIAGVRHLIMDFGFAEAMSAAKCSSFIVLLLGVLFSLFWGIWLWLL